MSSRLLESLQVSTWHSTSFIDSPGSTVHERYVGAFNTTQLHRCDADRVTAIAVILGQLAGRR